MKNLYIFYDENRIWRMKLKLKRIVAHILTSPSIGLIISILYKNRIPFGKFIIDTDIPEISAKTKAEIFWKIYESAEIRLIQKYFFHTNDVNDVIELGSSIGILSAIMRNRLPKDVRLFCVEAHPKLYSQIAVNLKINKLFNNVTLINKAISYSKSVNDYVNFTPGELSTTGIVEEGQSSRNSIQIEKTTLSEIVTYFNIDAYTLVADIEGAELSIIRNEKDVLKMCKHLFLELHCSFYLGNQVSVEDILTELIYVHGFILKERYGDVVYLNRK